MANTLTNLIPTLYEALDKVSRELVGFIPAVSRNSSIERAAKDQTVRIPLTQSQTAGDITPAVTPPDDGDQTVDNVSITISKARRVPVRWNGEQTRGMRTGGTFEDTLGKQFQQAFRALANEVEADLAGLYAKASRAFGTAGTTPFGTANEFDDAAEVVKILDDNGAPKSDRCMVLGTAAMAKLRGFQPLLLRVNESGSMDGLRSGIMPPIHGLSIFDSAEVDSHTAGTGSGYLLNDASSAIGDTTITVDTGSGTIVAGDVVTFAGDSNKYVVKTALSGTTFVVQEPGLRVAEDDNDAITVGSAYTANMAFHRDAIQLVTRLPALPDGGDSADDRQIIVDEHSGLAFEVAVYRQYRQVQYEVSLAWGYEMIKPEHSAILLG